ncbi:hypothetical protein RDABS01_012826 [Bienertia sinuspersici]
MNFGILKNRCLS